MDKLYHTFHHFVFCYNKTTFIFVAIIESFYIAPIKNIIICIPLTGLTFTFFGLFMFKLMPGPRCHSQTASVIFFDFWNLRLPDWVVTVDYIVNHYFFTFLNFQLINYNIILHWQTRAHIYMYKCSSLTIILCTN